MYSSDQKEAYFAKLLSKSSLSLFTSQSCKHLSLCAKRPVLCTQCSLCLYRSKEISDLERDWNEQDGRKAKEVSDVNIYM